ncbi:hypothetical protein [Solemya velum gill symbiont]|uniref:Uncharacterized protein n=1 Tax=Solemya velum gill symbiont TaxID=2340 RepID=A0A0B0HAQ9_SOVGS|nr:hypothetical protein [Solemya velum gill symbiont]KHF24521.1 hypothetical protein JV46_28800 [Solemya velum gill symbiont]
MFIATESDENPTEGSTIVLSRTLSRVFNSSQQLLDVNKKGVYTFYT